jgi:hypothetical protein
MFHLHHPRLVQHAIYYPSTKGLSHPVIRIKIKNRGVGGQELGLWRNPFFLLPTLSPYINWFDIGAYLPKARTVKPQKPRNARNNRSTSVYCSLLGNSRNSRKSSLASLVAIQRRGKHISAAVSSHATIAAAFFLLLCFIYNLHRFRVLNKGVVGG